jgi:hypothetical protein
MKEQGINVRTYKSWYHYIRRRGERARVPTNTHAIHTLTK